MKRSILFSIILICFIGLAAHSREISSLEATIVANNQLKLHQKLADFSTNNISEIKVSSSTLAYIVHLLPTGYIVVSSNTILPVIPAYSFESNFGDENSANTLYVMLVKNLLKLKNYIESKGNNTPIDYSQSWKLFLQTDGISKTRDFQQWPEVGDGWLKTNWTQSAPYSNFCPIDPVTSQRSYTGCPATAMSQILNFHGTANGTHFDNTDDYYHNYAGRVFNIDDDYAAHGFKSFPDLNMYLDTLQIHWNTNTILTNNDKAALNFACAVAAKEVFSSAGSGTYSVSQALDAYIRFGCTTAVLIQPDDTSLTTHLMQNMKDTLPAHLAIVDSGWTTGHNVVVDGYNTDGYFHVNFGWGGSSNGWYLLPQEMPMNLTYFEGVVVDIMKKVPAEIASNTIYKNEVKVFPNPFSDELNFSFSVQSSGETTLEIWDITGNLCLFKTFNTDKLGNQVLKIYISNIDSKLLFYRITTPDYTSSGKIIRVE